MTSARKGGGRSVGGGQGDTGLHACGQGVQEGPRRAGGVPTVWEDLCVQGRVQGRQGAGTPPVAALQDGGGGQEASGGPHAPHAGGAGGQGPVEAGGLCGHRGGQVQAREEGAPVRGPGEQARPPDPGQEGPRRALAPAVRLCPPGHQGPRRPARVRAAQGL
jgi:hypothetical protein